MPSVVNDCKRHHQQSELPYTSDFPRILLHLHSTNNLRLAYFN